MVNNQGYVTKIPEFQGYISPDVEDAIKNDSGGNYLLDFLKNGLLIVRAEIIGYTIHLSHSYNTIMKAIDRYAFVVVSINGDQYVLSSIGTSTVVFSRTYTDAGKVYVETVEINSQNEVSKKCYTITADDTPLVE